MQGQWAGMLKGDAEGRVYVDLDERIDCYTGTALLVPEDPQLPATAARIVTKGRTQQEAFTAPIWPVYPDSGEAISAAELAARFPNVLHAAQAEIELIQNSNQLTVSFKTEVSEGGGTINRFAPAEMSSFKGEQVTWAEFKAAVAQLDNSSLVWRGQPGRWALQTSFHRCGRHDLARYRDEDIPRLQTAIIPYTNDFIEADSPVRLGSLFNLAQHHGFPTPLLDWSFSPYVGAFFAFRKPPRQKVEIEDCARIFAFDWRNWTRSTPNLIPVKFAGPHLTLMEFAPLANPRSAPQQAVSMVTNVHDIEAFIRLEEESKKRAFIYAFDISWEERETIMSDLRLMGITAASMIPGLDGTCEELKDRWF